MPLLYRSSRFATPPFMQPNEGDPDNDYGMPPQFEAGSNPDEPPTPPPVKLPTAGIPPTPPVAAAPAPYSPPNPNMVQRIANSMAQKFPPPYQGTTAQPVAAAQSATPTLQDMPTRPTPKLWQRLASAGVGAAAGYVNAAGRVKTPIDVSAAEQGILYPGYAAQVAKVQDANQKAIEQGKLNTEAAQQANLGAQAAHARASVGLTEAQTEKAKADAAAIEQQGKMKLIPLKDGSLYDPWTHQVINQPKTLRERLQEYKDAGYSDDESRMLAAGQKVNENSLMNVDPAWAKQNLPMVMPDANGNVRVTPKMIEDAAKPTKIGGQETVAQEIAARNVAAKRGLKLDETKPLIPQLSPDAQADALKLTEQLATKPPDELSQTLKQLMIDSKRREAESANTPLDETQISTTMSGRKYVDATGYTGKALQELQTQARKAGVPIATKDQADALSQIDQARMNLADIEKQMTNKLPKDASGRVLGGALSNKLSAYLQADQILAAAGTYRTAAIQLMRAAAGSKGLRINKAEIEASMNNDIPQVTDTVGTAQQRLQNMRNMLENGERAILVRDRSVNSPSGNNTPTAPTAGGVVEWTRDANGNPVPVKK